MRCFISVFYRFLASEAFFCCRNLCFIIYSITLLLSSSLAVVFVLLCIVFLFRLRRLTCSYWRAFLFLLEGLPVPVGTFLFLLEGSPVPVGMFLFPLERSCYFVRVRLTCSLHSLATGFFWMRSMTTGNSPLFLKILLNSALPPPLLNSAPPPPIRDWILLRPWCREFSSYFCNGFFGVGGCWAWELKRISAWWGRYSGRCQPQAGGASGPAIHQ